MEDLLSGPTTTYSPQLAAALSRLARATYGESGERKIRSAYAKWDITTCDTYNFDDDYHDSVAYAIGREMLSDGRRVVVVTARGSWTGDDWTSEVLKTPGSVGWGWHPSFENCARDVYDTLSDRGDLDDDDTVYVLCGHSRGAATANLLAVLLSDDGVPKENVYCYCFGCPDVANGVAGLWNLNGVHDNILNLARANDIVSVLPGAAGDTLLSMHIPGVTWGKYGRSYWFADDWGDPEQTDLSTSGHDSAKDVVYFAKLPSLDKARGWAGAKAAWLARRAGQVASVFDGIRLRFFCPVDVTVMDASGEAIAAVVGGEPQYYDSEPGEVLILVEGDAKEFVLPEGDYSVDVEATDEGSMDCFLERVEEGEVTSSVAFEGVGLEEGKEMSTDVACDSVRESRLIVLDEDGEPIAEVLPDGEEVPYVAFSDVTASTAHYEDILWLAGSGISKGWDMPDGTKQFRPYSNVARADMAAFLFRLAKGWGLVDESWQPSGSASFRDVTSKTAHYREIMWLAETGISQGWDVKGGREFRPYANVARADMAAFLHRLDGLR